MTDSDAPAPPSAEERGSLATMVTTLFGRWGLEEEQQLALLGLSRRDKKTLEAHRKGEPLPADPETLGRAGALLAIHQLLAAEDPDRPERAALWIVESHPCFTGRRPLDVMVEDGIPGIRAVLGHLRSRDPACAGEHP